MKLGVYLGYFTGVVLALSVVAHVEGDDDHSHEGHGHSHADKAQVELSEVMHPTIPQELLKRLDLVETFQQGPKVFEKGWIASRNDRYTMSEWVVAATFGVKKDGTDIQYPGFKDEQSLAVHVAHRHYGLTHVLAEPFDNTGKTLVFQYEVRLHDTIGCSGAYAKLLLKQEKFDPLALEEATPYVIMFGPDKCGNTNKVHFIVRQKLPNNKWEEKHMAKAVPAKILDPHTHLYTLIVRPDNSFQVLVDEEEVASGSLLSASDFNPPFGAPKEVDDPTDKKPTDWVDIKEIPDPSAKKPEDWDEDAPKTIPDPDAKKPEGWSDEDDGVYEPPHIPNPEYKGKWKAPIIPNPEYKGEWAPKKIPNPDFFVDEHPSNLEPIGAVAFEILANERGIAFDNIVLTHDEAAAKEFAALTFRVKQQKEKTIFDTQRRKRELEERERLFEEGGPYGRVMYIWGELTDFVKDNVIPVVVSIVVLLMTCFYMCCWPFSSTAESSASAGEVAEEEEEEEEEEEGEKSTAASSKGEETKKSG